MNEQHDSETVQAARKPVNKIWHFIEFILAFGSIIALFGFMRYVSFKLAQH